MLLKIQIFRGFDKKQSYGAILNLLQVFQKKAHHQILGIVETALFPDTAKSYSQVRLEKLFWQPCEILTAMPPAIGCTHSGNLGFSQMRRARLPSLIGFFNQDWQEQKGFVLLHFNSYLYYSKPALRMALTTRSLSTWFL